MKQEWELEGLNFSKLEVSKARFGAGKRYEFRIRFGKTHLLFKFPDEVSSWSKFRKGSGDDFLDFVKEINSTAGLDSFKMEGPFELRLAPNHQASLLLPVCISDFLVNLFSSMLDLFERMVLFCYYCSINTYRQQ